MEIRNNPGLRVPQGPLSVNLPQPTLEAGSAPSPGPCPLDLASAALSDLARDLLQGRGLILPAPDMI